MDPKELQELGLFLILGIIMALLMKGRAGDYEGAITVVLYILFIIGLGLIVYGLFLHERMGKLIKGRKQREG